MKHLPLCLSLLLLFVIPAKAQQGLISGVVIAVSDEEDEPVSDVPVVVDGRDGGTTDDDGEVNIGIDSFDDGDDVVIRVKGDDDDRVIYVDEEGENNCDDDSEVEGEDDEDCLIVGYIRGWKPGRFFLHWDEDPTFGEDPSGEDDDNFDPEDGGFGHGEPEYRFQLLLGRNFEFEYTGITVRAQIPVPVGVPLTIDPTLEYFPGDDFRSLWIPSVDANCNFRIADPAEIFFGAGIRGYRQTFDFEGASNPDIEWGFGVRAGGLYPIGPIEAVAEIDITRVFETSVASFRLGASYALR